MILYTILYILLYIPVRIIYPVKVVNKKAYSRKTTHILICNHLSWKDALIMFIYFRGYKRLIGKKEVNKYFIVRIVAKGIGAILVDRENTDLTTMRTCISSLKSGKSLLVFPEGTRNRTGSHNLQEIKSGAAMMAIKGGAPVVPTILFEKQRAFRRNYVYVGEQVSFEQFTEGRLDSAKLAAATDYMRDVLCDVKERLDDYVMQNAPKKKRNL